MWLFTARGFFSVVAKGEPGQLQIRARVRADLDNLRQAIPRLGPTLELPGHDYAFRALIQKAELSRAIPRLIEEINYSNFKSEIGREDPEREKVYHKVWDVMYRLQPVPRMQRWMTDTAPFVAPKSKRAKPKK